MRTYEGLVFLNARVVAVLGVLAVIVPHGGWKDDLTGGLAAIFWGVSDIYLAGILRRHK